MRRLISLLLILMAAVFLTGCISYTLNIQFDSISGLKKDAPVIFEGSKIGSVERITYTDQGTFLVKVVIDKGFESAVTQECGFYIGGSPGNKGERAVVMVMKKKGGKSLESGATVKGADDPVTPHLESLLDQMNKKYNEFTADLRKIPENEQYRAFEKKLDEILEDLKASGKAMHQEIQQEILPKLKSEFEALKKRYESWGDQQRLEPLEKKMKAIEEI